MKKGCYSDDFYKDRGFLRSAKHIVPEVLKLISPKSVVDVGCNIGHFLQVFQEHGVDDILGIDGAWMNKKLLRIPEKKFQPHNLEKPLRLNRKFDLVVSLEVAEHLSKKSAITFVQSLTSLGDIIIFSAAIPYQGGTHHVNEQWPEYWTALFQEKGFVPIDALRKRLWHNKEINYPYKQNAILFVKRESLKKHKQLQREYEQTTRPLMPLVHPELYLSRAKTAKFFLQFIPFSIRKLVVKLRKRKQES